MTALNPALKLMIDNSAARYADGEIAEALSFSHLRAELVGLALKKATKKELRQIVHNVLVAEVE